MCDDPGAHTLPSSGGWKRLNNNESVNQRTKRGTQVTRRKERDQKMHSALQWEEIFMYRKVIRSMWTGKDVWRGNGRVVAELELEIQ